MAEREERANNGILSALIRRPQHRRGPTNQRQPTPGAAFRGRQSSEKQGRELGTAEIMKAAQEASETTRKQYSRIIARRLADTGPDLDGLSRASWYPARAALKVGLAGRVHAAMKAQSDAQKGGDYEKAAKLVRIADRAMDQLAALETAQAPTREGQKLGAPAPAARLVAGPDIRNRHASHEARNRGVVGDGLQAGRDRAGVDVFTDKTGGVVRAHPRRKGQRYEKRGSAGPGAENRR